MTGELVDITLIKFNLNNCMQYYNPICYNPGLDNSRGLTAMPT